MIDSLPPGSGLQFCTQGMHFQDVGNFVRKHAICAKGVGWDIKSVLSEKTCNDCSIVASVHHKRCHNEYVEEMTMEKWHALALEAEKVVE